MAKLIVFNQGTMQVFAECSKCGCEIVPKIKKVARFPKKTSFRRVLIFPGKCPGCGEAGEFVDAEEYK